MHRPEARGTKWTDGKELSDVKEACPKAIDLDLSRNLFEQWREVVGIVEQLEGVRGVRVE